MDKCRPSAQVLSLVQLGRIYFLPTVPHLSEEVSVAPEEGGGWV